MNRDDSGVAEGTTAPASTSGLQDGLAARRQGAVQAVDRVAVAIDERVSVAPSPLTTVMPPASR